MSIHVKLINNKPVSSNCYVISTNGNKRCIIVDPGEKERKQLFAYLGGYVCVNIDNHLFTGDFIIKENKANTKLPGGSNTNFKFSLEAVIPSYGVKKTEVFPGHGEPLYFHEIASSLESAIHLI